MNNIPRCISRVFWVFAFVSSAASAAAEPQPAGAAAEAKPSSAESPGSPGLQWLPELAPARQDAMVRRRPILVQFFGTSCPWCAKLDEELQQTSVQSELARWTLARIDAESSEEADLLAVTAIPALRVLTPNGRMVSSLDGYRPADELLAWLQKSREEVARSPDESLLADREPSLTETMRLVRQFRQRDALIREAAIRRLLPFPKASASAVVKTLEEGNLSARLAACELLTEWKAPLGQLDPWRPESITPTTIAALHEWLRNIDATANPTVEKLTEVQVKDLREQIGQMLAGNPEESVAARERIARLGTAALPEVSRQLQQARTDDERRRLLTLRLRLAADPSLVIRWQGGLERLADDDPQTRRKAAEELASIATSATQPLLLELFSHPDPLVREISLRGLKNIGGEEAVASLAQLLKDPEPNVRAAVLKQLAEDGAPELLTTIANYVEQEPDPDLIVHAIRYFSKTQSRRATESLIRLLKHTSWQVRADAAEALGSVLKNLSDSANTAQPIEEIYDGLLALLADTDAFAASRALQALERVNARQAVEPLVKATQQHPELAAKIVEVLAAGTQMRTAALPHLKNFLTHSDSMVRAAAVRGLSVMDAEHAEQPLRAALLDSQSLVRIAAAEGLLSVIAAGRPDASEEPTFSNFNRTVRLPENPNVDDWLAELAVGKHVPEWASSFAQPLEALLKAESGDERVAACLALAALGKPQPAMPVLLEMAPTTPKAFEQCCEVLKWLPRDQRLTCFHALEAMSESGEQRSKLIMAMNAVPDARNAELCWPALEHPGITREAIDAIDTALQQALLGDRFYDSSSVTPAMRREASAALTPQAKSGSPLKRLVAMNLMLQAAPDEALTLVQEFMEDAAVPPEIRADAFQLYLAGQTAGKATEAATAALAAPDTQRRMTALKFLAIGNDTLSYLPHAQLTVHLPSDGEWGVRSSIAPSGEPIVPMPPSRLKPESIRPLLSDPDPETAAYGGYLLTLFGEPEGLPPLLRFWRSLKSPDASVTRLVYRAIAALDDPAHLPELREIYAQLSKADASEFYWTIRSMTGPEILQFRRLIRQEVGMSQLK